MNRGGVADRILLLTVLLLLGLGSVVVFSSSTAVSEEYFGASTKMILNHLVKVAMGLGLLLFLSRVDYRAIRRLSLPLVAGSTMLLALTLVPNCPWAVTTKGATRWIDLGFMVVQPAELAKLALVVYIASILSSGEGRIRDYRRGFVPVLTVLGIFVVFLVQQPNFGNALTLSLLAGVMLFLGGARFVHLGGSGLATMPALAFLAVQRPHVIRRVEGFLDPAAVRDVIPRREGADGCSLFIADNRVAPGEDSLRAVPDDNLVLIVGKCAALTTHEPRHRRRYRCR